MTRVVSNGFVKVWGEGVSSICILKRGVDGEEVSSDTLVILVM